jgi:acetylornithine deacetylase/succinyl-diaminopimelate desuccinylase-like protein
MGPRRKVSGSDARRRVRRLLPLLIGAQLFAAPAVAAEPSSSTRFLADLVRIDTSNPPGDTRAVAQLLKQRFDAAGIPNEIILSPNGKAAHFIARLKGDGSRRPMLLAAHTDVVPADPSQWSVAPFGGVIRDGFLLGRGVLDNKGAVAAFAAALIRIREQRIALSRDIIFLAEADEEQGSFNTNWLAEHHWDKIDAEFSLNEGGSIITAEGRPPLVNITYADKLTVNLKLRAEGPAGHSSRPLPTGTSANDQLVAALQRLSDYREPIDLTPASRDYLRRLAAARPETFRAPVARLFDAREERDRAAAAEAIVAAGDDLSGWGLEGLLRNTLALTMLQSGLKPNIIPGAAEATLNARLIPGTSLDGFLDRLRRVIGNDRLSLSVLEGEERARLIRQRANITPSPIDTDYVAAIETAARRQWPGAAVLPSLFVASTDATPWRVRGVPVYGISPFPITAADARRVHGNDERVSLRAIDEGFAFVFDLVVGLAAKGGFPRKATP